MQARATESKRALLRELIDVMDNLGLALAQPGDVQTLRQGVQLTLRQLEKVLSRAGVQRMPVEPGQPFDPVYHEAIEVRDAVVSQDTVADVVYPGYIYEGFIIRPARVVVTRARQVKQWTSRTITRSSEWRPTLMKTLSRRFTANWRDSSILT